MRRPSWRHQPSAFFGVLLALWLVGALSGCGAALHAPSAAAKQGTPSATVRTGTATATPHRAASQGTLQGTLQGSVVAGPTCPVASAEDPCPPRPVPGSRVVIASPTGRVVATATTDAKGHFQVALAPGTYVVFVAGTAGTLRSQAARTQVTVRAGQPIAVTLMLDTGIR